VLAVRTNFVVGMEAVKTLIGKIRKVVPTGFKHHEEPQDVKWMPDTASLYNDLSVPCGDPSWASDFVVEREYVSARRQLGTLGGGNHFAELQEAKDKRLWVMIHSGSRNLGKKVADHYNQLAVNLNARWHSSVPKAWDLAFLPLETVAAQRYMAEMQYCVDFALANRKLMMDRVLSVLNEMAPLTHDAPINIAHNYAAVERHYGQDVVVHRKGATSARTGEVGIIPGSQGAPSYIVRGRGNRESFTSCSHGAGRRMGRKQAQRALDLAEQQRLLEGVVHSVRTTADLDEAPGAYKDIATVMANQTDLVEVVEELRPLGVVKG
jgi:tRNA-splicing ligase RtcB